MKPKPLLSLNHLTVPLVRIYRTPLFVDVAGGPGHAVPTDYASADPAPALG